MDAYAVLEIRSNLRMFQQMSIKITFHSCFKSTFCTLVQFTSNGFDKLWMFSNHM
ncbi:unnamed protein product, partial [Callosobruchus maculatus]